MRVVLSMAAAVAAALFIEATAVAYVSNLGPNRFISSHTAELPVPPARAFRDFGQLKRWWNPAHSYSGKVARWRFRMRAGDCFCERLARGGSVEHLRVLLVQPGERLVMQGGLGPLMFQGVAGTLDVQFQPTRRGTLVMMDYRVAGFAYANADKNAGIVDRVMDEQIKRYEAFVRARQARSSLTKA